VVASGGGTRVELGDLSGWDVRRLHTLSLPRTGGALEAHLRLQAGRVVGTVTNNGPRLVRRMRVQAEDGTRAELGAVAPPGAIVQVDAPFSGEATLNGSIEAAVLNIAAKSDRRSLGPGELALVGLVSDRPVLAGHESVRHKTAHRAVVTTVQLEAADDFVLVRQPGGTIRGDLAFGSAKSVCCGASQGRGIFEIRLPTGMAGPFGVEVAGRPRPRPQNLPEAAVYDWTGGTWRQLSPNPQTQAPIAPAEIMDGLVRIRLGTDIPTEGLKAVAIVAPK